MIANILLILHLIGIFNWAVVIHLSKEGKIRQLIKEMCIFCTLKNEEPCQAHPPLKSTVCPSITSNFSLSFEAGELNFTNALHILMPKKVPRRFWKFYVLWKFVESMLRAGQISYMDRIRLTKINDTRDSNKIMYYTT